MITPKGGLQKPRIPHRWKVSLDRIVSLIEVYKDPFIIGNMVVPLGWRARSCLTPRSPLNPIDTHYMSCIWVWLFRGRSHPKWPRKHLSYDFNCHQMGHCFKPFPWLIEADFYECVDGILCNTTSCCNSHGGRARCPASMPVMCPLARMLQWGFRGFTKPRRTGYRVRDLGILRGSYCWWGRNPNNLGMYI